MPLCGTERYCVHGNVVSAMYKCYNGHFHFHCSLPGGFAALSSGFIPRFRFIRSTCHKLEQPWPMNWGVENLCNTICDNMRVCSDLNYPPKLYTFINWFCPEVFISEIALEVKGRVEKGRDDWTWQLYKLPRCGNFWGESLGEAALVLARPVILAGLW